MPIASSANYSSATVEARNDAKAKRSISTVHEKLSEENPRLQTSRDEKVDRKHTVHVPGSKYAMEKISEHDTVDVMMDSYENVELTSSQFQGPDKVTGKTLMRGSFDDKSVLSTSVLSTDARFVDAISSVSGEEKNSGDSNVFHEQVLANSQTQLESRDSAQGEDNDPLPEGDNKYLENISKFRKKIGAWVHADRFQAVVLLLIIVNSIMLGVGTFSFVKDDPIVRDQFETADFFFLVMFTTELVMQFICHGFALFLDGWLFFDFTVVTVSWAFFDASFVGIRAFRVFRTLRLVTRIKTMKELVAAVFSVVPQMAAIMMLLLLIFYIFAVMFTQLFKDMYKNGQTDQPYFDSLDKSMFTLFQMMCMDEWEGIARDVKAVYSWAWIIFISFIVITGFIVINLIIAVISDSVQVSRKVDNSLLKGDFDGDENILTASLVDNAPLLGLDGGTDDMNGPEDISTVSRLQQKLDGMEVQMDQAMQMQAETIKNMRMLSQALKTIRTQKEK